MASEDLRKARLQEHKSQLDELDNARKQAKEAVKKAKQAYNDAMRTGNVAAQKQAKDYFDRVSAAEKEVSKAYNDSAADYDANLSATQTKNVVDTINTTKEVINNVTGENTKERKPLSRGFYDALSSGVTGTFGNENDAKAQKAQATADNLQNASAVHGAEAAQHQQIANQNPYTEAGKIASVQNDAQNRQAINNTSFAAGTAAARLRQTNAPNVQTQINRQDQQRTQAEQQRNQSLNDQTTSDMNRADANQFRIASRDYYRDKEEAEQSSQAEQPNTSINVNYNDDNTSNQGANQNAQPQQKPQVQPEQTPEQTPESQVQPIQLTEEQQNTKDSDLTFEDLANQLGFNPGQPGNETNYMMLYHWLINHKDYHAGPRTKEWLNNTFNALNKSTNGVFKHRLNSMKIDPDNIPSDSRIKNLQRVVSDERMKLSRQWLDEGMLDADDFDYLAKQHGGKFNHNGKEYDYFNEDKWDDDVLKGYADYIRNYLYTYKPEATQIDSSIDPNQEHIGPMAQDIEKVNPACIQETPEGVKEVDTARLSMMNAGVIGDLARRLQALEEAIYERN